MIMWANPNNMPSMKEVLIFSMTLFSIILLVYFGCHTIASIIIGILLVIGASRNIILTRQIDNNTTCNIRNSKDFVDKPWGGYRNVAEGGGYKIKILVLLPNEATSLQSHEHRKEVWTIAKGTAIITYGNSDGNKEFVLKQGDTVKILAGYKHRITNYSAEDPLIITEVWLGDILDEEDIIRYEDKYGRA